MIIRYPFWWICRNQSGQFAPQGSAEIFIFQRLIVLEGDGDYAHDNYGRFRCVDMADSSYTAESMEQRISRSLQNSIR